MSAVRTLKRHTNHKDSNVPELKAENTLFGTNIPPSEAAMRDAMGESATKTVEGKTESSALDDLATNFIKNLTRGPGR